MAPTMDGDLNKNTYKVIVSSEFCILLKIHNIHTIYTSRYVLDRRFFDIHSGFFFILHLASIIKILSMLERSWISLIENSQSNSVTEKHPNELLNCNY